VFQRTTRLFSESLARSMDRRGFLKRASQVTFASMAALAAGQAGVLRASAATRKPPILTPNCAPPGPYCSIDGNILSGCHGASCFQHLNNGQVLQCRFWYIYQAGCWTTPTGTGYWTCCDCECFDTGGTRQAASGCAQYSDTPSPRPDSVGGPTGA